MGKKKNKSKSVNSTQSPSPSTPLVELPGSPLPTDYPSSPPPEEDFLDHNTISLLPIPPFAPTSFPILNFNQLLTQTEIGKNVLSYVSTFSHLKLVCKQWYFWNVELNASEVVIYTKDTKAAVFSSKFGKLAELIEKTHEPLLARYSPYANLVKSLYFKDFISLELFEYFQNKFPNVTKVTLEYQRVSGLRTRHLNQFFPNVTTVVLKPWTKGIEHLPNCTRPNLRIQELYVKGDSIPSQALKYYIPNMANLSVLSLDGIVLDPALLEEIATYSNSLKTLELIYKIPRNYDYHRDNSIDAIKCPPLADQELAQVLEMNQSSLVNLTLDYPIIIEDLFARLINSSTYPLRTIALRNLRDVHPSNLIKFFNSVGPHLKQIKLIRLPHMINDELIQMLSNFCTHLTHLELSAIEFTEFTLKNIRSHFPNLTHLTLIPFKKINAKYFKLPWLCRDQLIELCLGNVREFSMEEMEALTQFTKLRKLKIAYGIINGNFTGGRSFKKWLNGVQLEVYQGYEWI